MSPLQICDQELVSIHREAKLWDFTVTGDGQEELSEVNQHVIPWCASRTLVLWWLMDGHIRSSCVSECGLGSADSGSGPVSGCGWSAGMTPWWAQPVLRSRRRWRGCRGPQHTGWCSSQRLALDCRCCSHCWRTETQTSMLAGYQASGASVTHQGFVNDIFPRYMAIRKAGE